MGGSQRPFMKHMRPAQDARMTMASMRPLAGRVVRLSFRPGTLLVEGSLRSPSLLPAPTPAGTIASAKHQFEHIEARRPTMGVFLYLSSRARGRQWSGALRFNPSDAYEATDHAVRIGRFLSSINVRGKTMLLA